MPTRLSGDDRLERSIVRTSKTLSPGFWGGFVFGIAKKVSELDRRERGGLSGREWGGSEDDIRKAEFLSSDSGTMTEVTDGSAR